MKSPLNQPSVTISAGEQLYDTSFFSGATPGSIQSGRILLGLLFAFHHPKSVIDVGCGQGGWLAAAEELGASKLVGVDGPWVNPLAMASGNIQFSAVNLEDNFNPTEKFDLCISVEVAEHLPPNRSRGFVNDLCSASDVVVFSAAIEQQGGVNHINERKQSYWAELFAAAGYECYDFFRPQLWNDQRVDTWYRQNVLLYIRRNHPIAEAIRTAAVFPAPLDLVHPELFHGNLENWQKLVEEPTLGYCCQAFARWGCRQLRKVTASRKK